MRRTLEQNRRSGRIHKVRTKCPPHIEAIVRQIGAGRKDMRVVLIGDDWVVCPDQGTYMMYRHRLAALIASGDPAKRKCWVCHRYDTLNNFRPDRNVHPACHDAQKKLYARSDRRAFSRRPRRAMGFREARV